MSCVDIWAAREAKAEAEAADAKLEQEILGRIGDLREKIAQGTSYLQELLGVDDDKAGEIEKKYRKLKGD